MELRAPLDLFDPDKLRGSYDLGFNGTGVIRDRLIIDGDSMTRVSEMPGVYVQQCMDEVARLSHRIQTRRPGGELTGRLPMPIYEAWRREWNNGPKQHGVLWRAFFNQKFYDRDYSKFRVGA